MKSKDELRPTMRHPVIKPLKDKHKAILVSSTREAIRDTQVVLNKISSLVLIRDLGKLPAEIFTVLKQTEVNQESCIWQNCPSIEKEVSELISTRTVLPEILKGTAGWNGKTSGVNLKSQEEIRFSIIIGVQ